MNCKTLFRIAFLVLLTNQTLAQTDVPFSKGVNVTNWFSANSAQEIQFSRFTREDLEQIKSLGCDVIRLPINLHYMTDGEPDYTLDPLFLYFLDQVVTWAEELELHIILDNHTFDPILPTPTDIGDVLVPVWSQMADHFKNRSQYVYYEVLNEPHGIDAAVWSAIQQDVIDAIREEDEAHWIIVGGVNYNSYNDLDELPVYTDTKLIYTFHFYDPFIFTHQGASWVEPSMVPLHDVPFPYNAAQMPTVPPELDGTWIEGALGSYNTEGTIAKVKSLIDIAADFSTSRNVPVFCGELGVMMNNIDNANRVEWYETVREYLEEQDITWTSWDYKGAFGLFEKGSNEMFEYDLNVPLLQALGFTVPPQSTYVKTPLTNGLLIYDDFIGEGISDGSYTPNGVRNLYDDSSPHTGDFCLYWIGGDQYSYQGFDFKPELDLSLLRTNNHTIQFWVRSNSSTSKIDIRFLDTKTGPTDHPWRMGTTLENFVTGDMTWQFIEIPLQDLEEKGSYDEGWFPAENKFDWKSVGKLEIVAEHHALGATRFWFDGIGISITDEPEPPLAVLPENKQMKFTVVPNPVTNKASIHFSLDKQSAVELGVYSITGHQVSAIKTPVLAPGNHSLQWDAQAVQPGFYILKIKSRTQEGVKKVVKAE